MKVILTEDVRKVGKKGEVIEVSDGYANNYLIARGLAQAATSGALANKKAKDEADHRRDEKLKNEALQKSTELNGKIVRVAVTAGEGGRVFGSVTTAQIAEALHEQYSLTIDKKKIKIDETPKNLGSYPIVLKLHSTVESKMTLMVEQK